MDRKKAYHVLELEHGANKAQIKQAHRRLVRLWHPDKHLDDGVKAGVTKRLIEVNEAYRYLTRLKSVSEKWDVKTTKINSKKKDKPHFERQTRAWKRPQASMDASSFRSDKIRNKRSKAHITPFKRGPIEDWIARRASKMKLEQLRIRGYAFSQRIERRNQKIIAESERAFRTFKNSPYVGLYSSLLNRMLSKMVDGKEKQETLPDVYKGMNKYRVLIHHENIKDLLFYRVNSGVNILLKGLISFVAALLFIHNAVNHVFFLEASSTLVYAELWLVAIIAAVLLPDNLFQRVVLLNLKSISWEKIHQLFQRHRIPPPWKWIFWVVFSLKMIIIAVMIHFYARWFWV